MTDAQILALVQIGRIRVDARRGLIYSPLSNTPNKPLGTITPKGYVRACINIGGKPRGVFVHRVVALVSLGLPPVRRPHVNHRNARKADNRAANLEWSSNSENLTHAGALGLLGKCRGNAHHWSWRKGRNVGTNIRRGE